MELHDEYQTLANAFIIFETFCAVACVQSAKAVAITANGITTSKHGAARL